MASPQEALAAPPEEFVYVAALHTGTGVEEPDFLAVVDVNPQSGQITHRTPMPNVGDELHHYGWHRCSSACHSTRRIWSSPGSAPPTSTSWMSAPTRVARNRQGDRRRGGQAQDRPSAPHTVHCMPGEIIVISMLGDANGDAPGGFAVLDANNFDVLGRWEVDAGERALQLRLLVPAAQERDGLQRVGRAQRLLEPGFNLDDVGAGKYGQRIHFWDLAEKHVTQTIDLGDEGLIPLEVRWLHDPDADDGYVGAALSSAMFRWSRENGGYRTDKVIQVESVEVAGWPFPVPGLITDLVVSMDDRFLYFSNWLHGDLRQYDISDPANPKLTGQVWLGGVLGHATDATARWTAARRCCNSAWTAAPLRDQLALLHLGQPVLPRHGVLDAARSTATRTAA